MIYSAWWIWLAFMFVLLVTPASYGWGYRGWGPPLPSYVQRQRVARGYPFAGRPPHTHTTWGYGGDLIWALVFILALWALGWIW
jgi:hypothetical protein